MDPMKKLNWILWAALLVTLGCAPEEIDFTKDDNGKTVQLLLRRTIAISLQSNMTTGYRWNLSGVPDSRVLKLISSNYIAPKRGLLGAGGVEVWRFRTKGPGVTTLTLAYFRPFEPNVPPAREFKLTVDVR